MTADRLGTAKSPSLLLACTEFARASFEIGSLPFAAPLLMQAPKGDGHPVLLLPGFMAGEGTMKPLFKFLERLGYAPYQWDLGRNLGQKAIGSEGEKMVARDLRQHRTENYADWMVAWRFIRADAVTPQTGPGPPSHFARRTDQGFP
jgi:hypothetical protein